MKKKNILTASLLSSIALSCLACGGNTSSVSSNSFSTSDSTVSSVDASSEEKPVYSYRKDRDFTSFKGPSDVQDETSFPLLSAYQGKDLVLSDGNLALLNGAIRLDFVKDASSHYALQLVSIVSGAENVPSSVPLFANATPVRVYLRGSNASFLQGYDTVVATSYGYKAVATLTSAAGSVLLLTDCYYLAKEQESGSFNVSSKLEVTSAASADTGFAQEYTFTAPGTSLLEWMAPGLVYKTLASERDVYRESYLGAPMSMMRNSVTGATLSLARYQPVITYENDCFASFELNKTSRCLTVAYPSNEANRKYHALSPHAKQVYDVSIRAEISADFLAAMSSVYNAEFNLQNQRIVNTDIDEVYKVINEDYKTFLHQEEQEDPNTGKKYVSYGLPWRITIQDGEFGPYTYQAGFIGQQIPSAYNMMLYGLKANDLSSLQNGIHVIDFWVSGSEFMSLAGVPHIWYDTWSDGFRSYPCFLRMAVDAMEGLLDAYRLAVAHGISKDTWRDAIDAFASFLVNNQNEDGSYYRCYNYEGGPFVSWDDGIEEPTGNICQSTAKSSSTMPIRFLAKMYEMTGLESYKNAALKAGEYVYANLYPAGVYYGGTCDGPNQMDKEGGVYAMYAFDTLYMLSQDSKWLAALKEAAAFTMSTVLIVSYPVKASTLKAAYPLYYGYNDGMSLIACTNGSGVDNYASYIYYELFRIYILSGDKSYLKQAEFIQQNTKSIMNWDGTLNYKYKSLVAEASGISTFTFSSASDGAWVTWSSVANVEPIAKMYTNFGQADVMAYAKTSLADLQSALTAVGCGGKAHKVYPNTVVSSLEA